MVSENASMYYSASSSTGGAPPFMTNQQHLADVMAGLLQSASSPAPSLSSTSMTYSTAPDDQLMTQLASHLATPQQVPPLSNHFSPSIKGFLPPVPPPPPPGVSSQPVHYPLFTTPPLRSPDSRISSLLSQILKEHDAQRERLLLLATYLSGSDSPSNNVKRESDATSINVKRESDSTSADAKHENSSSKADVQHDTSAASTDTKEAINDVPPLFGSSQSGEEAPQIINTRPTTASTLYSPIIMALQQQANGEEAPIVTTTTTTMSTTTTVMATGSPSLSSPPLQPQAESDDVYQDDRDSDDLPIVSADLVKRLRDEIAQLKRENEELKSNK